MISISSLSLDQTPPRDGATPPPAGALSLTAFSRDRTIFDSGAGFGRALAAVPVRGTGTPGAVVEARAVSLDDGGAATTAWTEIATIGGAGTWSGALTVARSSSWFRPEVRLKALPGIAAQGAARFGVGHVIAIWGQSEPDRILSTFHDNTTPPPVADPEAVQIFQGAAGTPARQFISNAQPLTAAAAALAATLIAARPGEKFAVIFQTVPGTDPRDLVDDANPARSWAADRALHAFATADGQHVGLAAMSWFAAPGNLGASYGEAMLPLFSGKKTDGTAVSFPATITYGSGQSYRADHWFGELYDYAHTRWVAYGPHRFDIDADMRDATHYAGGGDQLNLANKEAARKSWRAMLAMPGATMFLPCGIEPVTYVNGYADGAGGWTDLSHPAGNTPDGCQAWARFTAHAILQAAGLSGWAAPVFDQCLWEPSGAWVELWSSAGPVTTTRLKRGEAALGSGQPHWTEVMGFQINGLPAVKASIVAGRVRILPNSGSFSYADTVQYGNGGATGMIGFPGDQIAGTWKNLPIVDLGAAGLDGVPVRPLADAAVVANTLPVATPRFATSATGPYFLDPVNLPAGTSARTFAGRFRVPALPTTTAILFTQVSTGFDVELMNNGALRFTVEDGAGTKMRSAHTVATALAANVWYDLVCAADQVAAVLRVTINGALVATVPFTGSGNGVFQSTRALGFLARNNATLQFVGDVEYLRVWRSATVTGAAPATTPYKQILGPASATNADAWKLGANAT
ncbi:LamG-like jellyroll fold domain-containing protein [Defluviimonas sp. D31]|uniref:LamG-like jellyroll fold domain-containing protein n=1 Tax=Defluviimonas sp. D31 TaxID=3083253 RepID=UPI00296F9D93|nr:LamG-like jellyroll fold domain-containing protein [Defluviimonas sp. D31]MDW4550099.1 LamG-like jellyroll fold domain-containing protein [Defluviimonas sp. D31]